MTQSRECFQINIMEKGRTDFKDMNFYLKNAFLSNIFDNWHHLHRNWNQWLLRLWNCYALTISYPIKSNPLKWEIFLFNKMHSLMLFSSDSFVPSELTTLTITEN